MDKDRKPWKMLRMGDLIIIGFLIGACCLFIFVIIVVRRLLCRYDNKQQKSDSFLKFLVKNEERTIGNYLSSQKSNAFFVHDSTNIRGMMADDYECYASSSKEVLAFLSSLN